MVRICGGDHRLEAADGLAQSHRDHHARGNRRVLDQAALYLERPNTIARRGDDVICTPHEGEEDPRLNIVAGEIVRAVEFGRSALNPAAITDLERIALRFATDYKALLSAGYEDDE